MNGHSRTFFGEGIAPLRSSPPSPPPISRVWIPAGGAIADTRATDASRSRARPSRVTCTGSPTGSSRRGRCARTASAGSRTGRGTDRRGANRAGTCYTSWHGRERRWRAVRRRHVRSYRETGGEYGHLWRGAPTLLLTTKGAKSGEPRTMALIYGRSGDDYLLVASDGGARDHPAVVQEPRASTRRSSSRCATRCSPRAHARRPTRRSRRCGRRCSATGRRTTRYQAKTDRPIPVVVLERVA